MRISRSTLKPVPCKAVVALCVHPYLPPTHLPFRLLPLASESHFLMCLEDHSQHVPCTVNAFPHARCDERSRVEHSHRTSPSVYKVTGKKACHWKESLGGYTKASKINDPATPVVSQLSPVGTLKHSTDIWLARPCLAPMWLYRCLHPGS